MRNDSAHRLANLTPYTRSGTFWVSRAQGRSYIRTCGCRCMLSMRLRRGNLFRVWSCLFLNWMQKAAHPSLIYYGYCALYYNLFPEAVYANSFSSAWHIKARDELLDLIIRQAVCTLLVFSLRCYWKISM